MDYLYSLLPNRVRLGSAALSVVMMLLAACGGSGGDSTDQGTQTNVAPVANAGPDQTVNEQVLVSLDGRASADSDGVVSVYEWTQLAGTNVTLNQTNPEMPTFTAPDLDVNETLTFQLIVTDDDGATDSVSKPVTVTEIPVEIYVYDITQSIKKMGRNYESTAVVTIWDTDSNPVANFSRALPRRSSVLALKAIPRRTTSRLPAASTLSRRSSRCRRLLVTRLPIPGIETPREWLK